MPLYDFHCQGCGRVFEEMAAVEEGAKPCPECNHVAGRLVSVGRAYRADAPWIESVVAVAEKDSNRPHVKAFVAAPGRQTYRDWMRGEGIRPLEAGEGRRNAPPMEPVRREVMERFRARRGLL